MNFIAKVFKNRWIFRSIIQTIIFNFKNLPIRQAIHLPILLYKPKVLSSKGKITINSPIKFGMIKLGNYQVSLYPNTGIVIENSGNIIFEGNAFIGNASAISVGKSGTLFFGKNFGATCGFKIACYDKIEFNENVLVGWDNLFSDTDFHSLTRINGQVSKGFGPITIGHDTWIANGCRIYKNTIIQPYTVVSANSVISNYRNDNEKTIIGNDHRIIVKKIGVYRNKEQDKINYLNHNES